MTFLRAYSDAISLSPATQLAQDGGHGASSAHATWRAGKRLLDYAAAALGVLLLCPLMLGVAVLIRLDSKGPVLFRQQRLGRGGRPFAMWKFRTMVVNAEDFVGELERLNESR